VFFIFFPGLSGCSGRQPSAVSFWQRIAWLERRAHRQLLN